MEVLVGGWRKISQRTAQPPLDGHYFINMGVCGSWYMEQLTLAPCREVTDFQLNVKGLPFSLLSFPEATCFMRRPLTSHWRAKTQRNKQATNKPTNKKPETNPQMAKHKNIQPKHLTCYLLAFHLPETKCFSSLILRDWYSGQLSALYCPLFLDPY